MGWISWTRKTTRNDRPGNACRGLDFSASRVRAAFDKSERHRIFPLDPPNADLSLAISLVRRKADLGQAGKSLARKFPHAVCASYLAALDQPREWKHGRHRLDAAAAIGVLFDNLRPLFHASDAVYVGLPPYISAQQAATIASVAQHKQFPLRGTVASALALAADRAHALMTNQPLQASSRVEGVVPLCRPGQAPLPTDVIVVDADDHALSAVLVRLEAKYATLVSTSIVPDAGLKKWKDELIDAIADRCVRVCRRDPRDSADAEQSLDEQIETYLDTLDDGRPVMLTVRAANWYQDLRLVPEDLVAGTSRALRTSIAGVRKLLSAGQALVPPRAVLLTHEAGRLPGLAKALYRNMTEATSVGVLRPEAVAAAVARLGERWPATTVTHLDHSIPLPASTAELKPQPSLSKTKAHR